MPETAFTHINTVEAGASVSGGGRRDPAAVERFVEERARPGASNGSAALKAGLTNLPHSARVIGHLLMRDATVRARVAARRAAPPGLLVAVAAPSVGLTRFAFAEFGDTRELMQRLGGDSPVPLQLVASWDARGWTLERVRASVASHHSHGVWYKLPRGALAEVERVVESSLARQPRRGIM
jgi:hypothetical protein